MIRAAIFNLVCGFAAYQQADLCQHAFQRLGFWAAALTLFFCFMANRIAAAWWKGHA